MKHKDRGDVGVGTMLLVTALLLIGSMMLLYVLQIRELALLRDQLSGGLRIAAMSSPVALPESGITIGPEEIVYDEAQGIFIATGGDDEYGDILLNPEETYDAFLRLVRENVYNLMDTLSAADSNPGIESYRLSSCIIYNVKGDRIEAYVFSSTGTMRKKIYAVGAAKTPGGQVVLATSVYGKVIFDYRDYFGRSHKSLQVEQYMAVRRKI